MSTPDRSILLAQLDGIRHNGLLAMLKQAADANHLPLAYVVAIASRETNCKNILGDYQGGHYHGVGILQRDVQHADAKQARDDDTWETPEGTQKLIDANVTELAHNVHQATDYFDDVTPDDVFKIAASGYNTGIGRAIEDAKDGGDSDAHTTGHDYGADVLRRKAIFDDLLGSSA